MGETHDLTTGYHFHNIIWPSGDTAKIHKILSMSKIIRCLRKNSYAEPDSFLASNIKSFNQLNCTTILSCRFVECCSAASRYCKTWLLFSAMINQVIVIHYQYLINFGESFMLLDALNILYFQNIQLIARDVANSDLDFNVDYARSNLQSFHYSKSWFQVWKLRCSCYELFIKNCTLVVKITEVFNMLFENVAGKYRSGFH